MADIPVEFETPPVIEMMVGVQFNPLRNFTNAHWGKFWASALCEDEWPTVMEAAALESQQERFGEELAWGRSGLRFQLSSVPPTRLQIKSRDETRLIQLQNGRCFMNWLGYAGNEYPRYSQIRTEFSGVWNKLLKFLSENFADPPLPDQWEVTYVNRIPRGSVWETVADWDFFRPLAAPVGVEAMIEPESFAGEWHYQIPEERGRLHIRWQHITSLKKKEDEQVTLTFTARGPLASDKDGQQASEIMSGIDLGHEVIVRSFAGLMSERAKQYWGAKHEPCK